jgi:hypothetical protein
VERRSHRDRAVTLLLRDGFVTDEFIDLARTEERDAGHERRLDELKRELADRVMGREPSEVYEVGETI